MEDTYEKIYCRECGKQLKRIQITHLKTGCTSSPIDIQEYKRRHPEAPLVSKKTCSETGVTKERIIRKYGEVEGLRRWEHYCNLQAETNTFEYKKRKYGWTEEQFDQYNSSRAITLENLVRKYGETDGEVRYTHYVELQKYAGSCEEYFIEKLGEDAGRKKWKDVNLSKANTLENFIKKYGEEDGRIRHHRMIVKKSETLPRDCLYSRASERYFQKVRSVLGETYDYKYAKDEICLVNEENRLYFYDCCINNKVIIEYNGDLYHANPKMYGAESVPKFRGSVGRTAKEIWEHDKKKLDFVKNLGYEVIVVWESEAEGTFEDICQKIISLLQKNLQ